ncbi:MAG: glutamate synthase subunit beta [Candidatus Margulisiibacteriota bacterium]
MGNPKGFLKIKRKKCEYRPVCERVKDYGQVALPRSIESSKEQAARCMDCGTPFCHWGCPIGNVIPEWNDLLYNGLSRRAFELLDSTNNLPEVTGRVCPAPCEFACVLGINDDPVTIRENELAIIEHAFDRGYIKPKTVKKRTGKKVAVIGSGPAGLSCAAQLNLAGHLVTVFEKDEKIGGIMRYGIPDFKLEKKILERRKAIWEKEGVIFKTGVNAGADLFKDFDAVCLAGGSRVPRDLKIEGRELKGVYFAMEYLTQSNRRVSGEKIPADQLIDAKGKKVVVIGGGDTGSDCVGTAQRQGASCVVQIELLPKPGEQRPENQPWPKYPTLLKTTTSHEEGGERQWSISTKEFKGQNLPVGKAGSKVKSLVCIRVDDKLKEISGTEFEIEADLVLLALGFLHPEKIKGLDIELDPRGNFKTDDNFMTSSKGIFAAGDMRRGQSLIVWAISEGRRAAYNIDKYLMRESLLPVM